MAQQHTIRMPLEYVIKTLRCLDLHFHKRPPPDGNGIQIKLTNDGYGHVSINAYKSGSVVVQPRDATVANFVRGFLAMRSAKLQRKWEIE